MRYWIGLGSNLGERLETLRLAVDQLRPLGSDVLRSRVFATSPVGGPAQPSFLNAAMSIDLELEPRACLKHCQAIEANLGRDRATELRWGPRPIDLDILLAGAHGEEHVRLPELQIPHPLLAERAFALFPLVDLDPTLVHPVLGRPLSELLSALQQTGKDLVAPTGEKL